MIFLKKFYLKTYLQKLYCEIIYQDIILSYHKALSLRKKQQQMN